MANPLASGQSRSTEPVLVLDGHRFLIAEDRSGKVSWAEEMVTTQAAEVAEAFYVRMGDMSRGFGYTWQGPEGTYDYADGWDASARGKVTTWPHLASGEAFTTTDAKAWALFLGGYLYVGRGRYIKRYVPDPTSGSTWSVAATKDVGAFNVVGGRPVAFQGKGYWPVRVGALGTAAVWQQLETPDTWTAGPAGEEAIAFRVWRNELVRANVNVIAKCATTPTTGGNWGAEYEIGDSGFSITDMVVNGSILFVGKTNGLYSIDESLQVRNELPDLEAVVDDNNFLGMESAQGEVLCPHKNGLIRYTPGAYAFAGAELEGGLDGTRSRGWGRYVSVAPFGRQTFLAANDLLNNRGALVSLDPTGGRETQTLTPHMHQSLDDGYIEALLVISAAASPSVVTEGDTAADDSAVGTITWASPSNALASDNAYATAAVGTSHYLKVTGFGFSVPATATITGVEVKVERSATE